MPGTLFVVATPIGNLEDLSFRALRTLKEVDLIAAEDTRRTSRLLAHYGIRKTLVSLREHNERREAPRLLARLQAGQSIALVSDAGTPGIADPGQHLVRLAREAGLPVSPIPGPSAVMAALSASGEPADQFVFLGFPPRSGTARAEWFKGLQKETRTAVFFEAPHRIARMSAELSALLVNRQILIHREITKINEEFVVCTNTSTCSLKELGEFVVVVSGYSKEKSSFGTSPDAIRKAVLIFDCLTNNEAFGEEESLAIASAACSIEDRVIRKAVKLARIRRRRQEESRS